MYQIIAYLKFLFSSTNQHGVHSPFIYNVVTKCLYDHTTDEAYKDIEAYRNNLHQSKETIEVLDLGQGSKTLNNQKRPISRMAKTSSSSTKNAKLLLRLVKYFNCRSILELGTSLGIATYSMAKGNSAARITTIEGCPNTSNFAKERFKELQITNSKFVIGDFASSIPNLTEATFDFIFFDGHHNKSATIQYFEALLPKAHNDCVFVFDDIYWSRGMTEAWEYIKNHNAVTVTVDTFYLGIVFFRKEQEKEHFKIRL